MEGLKQLPLEALLATFATKLAGLEAGFVVTNCTVGEAQAGRDQAGPFMQPEEGPDAAVSQAGGYEGLECYAHIIPR